MSTPIVLADANVLYSAVLRDLLLELAVRRAIRLHWTDAIQEEWITALVKNRPDLDTKRLQITRERMDTALPSARVTGYEHLIESVVLPDPKDRHVLAAAMAIEATIVLTFNTVDFPAEPAASAGRPVAVHPDEFIRLMAAAVPDVLRVASRVIIGRTRSEKDAVSSFVKALARSGLPESARTIRVLLDD